MVRMEVKLDFASTSTEITTGTHHSQGPHTPKSGLHEPPQTNKIVADGHRGFVPGLSSNGFLAGQNPFILQFYRSAWNAKMMTLHTARKRL